MSITYTYTSATRNSIIDALEAAETALTAFAEIAHQDRLHELGERYEAVAQTCTLALLSMDVEDETVVPFPTRPDGGAA